MGMFSVRRLKMAALALLSSLSFAPPSRAEPPRPNIIFIMADDLGNADLGYRGGEINTPNIDKLANEGVRLEDFYGMPVCTPFARATDDRALRHALRPADARHLPEPHLWAGDRRADASAGAEGSGLQDADGRQVAPRPRRPEILAAEPRLRLFLRQRHRRGELFHPRARRRDRLAAERHLPQGTGLLHRR